MFRGLFAGTREAIKNMLKKPETRMFPVVIEAPPEDYRGKTTLTPENCILCQRCIRICPTWALSIEKITKDTANFSIDLGRCCYCQECEHVCNDDAIHLTLDWLTASGTREGTIVSYFVDRTIAKARKKEEKE